MKPSSKIWVAGHRGLVGGAIVKELEKRGFDNLLLRTHSEVDLTNQAQVENLIGSEKPEYVFLAAAKVGGILANSTYPADFIYQNLMIASNVIHASYKFGVKKLLNLGSSCIYPKMAPQPMKEEFLLTGPLEPTNEAYAIAKITAIKLCRHYHVQYGADFLSAMPTNLYGIGDNFDLKGSHVLPALMRKFHEAKLKREESVEIWGTGTPLREFLFNEDLAEACVFLMERQSAESVGEFINVGSGIDLTIRELAELVYEVVRTVDPVSGWKSELRFDSTKPDGTPRKLMDVTRINSLGWKAKTSLRDGIEKTYRWFLNSEPFSKVNEEGVSEVKNDAKTRSLHK